MRRVACEVAGRPIYSFAVVIFFGAWLGIVVLTHLARLEGLPAGRVYLATLLILPLALGGARLLFVALRWQAFRDGGRRIGAMGAGGASILGGLPLIVLTAVPVTAALALPLGAFLDVSIFGMLIGMSIGRYGCLLNGCCCGRATAAAWGLRLTDVHGTWARRIPVQFIEIAVIVALLVALRELRTTIDWDGALFLLGVAGYSAARFALDPLRQQAAEERRGPLTEQQWISGLLAVSAVSLFTWGWWRGGLSGGG